MLIHSVLTTGTAGSLVRLFLEEVGELGGIPSKSMQLAS